MRCLRNYQSYTKSTLSYSDCQHNLSKFLVFGVLHKPKGEKIVPFNTDDILDRISMCIKEKGWSKEDFYEKSGITSASFSQWNTKRHLPSTKKLKQAADCLGVSLEYLINGDENKKTAIPEDDGMESKDARLLAWFRSLPQETQKSILYDANAPEGLV